MSNTTLYLLLVSVSAIVVAAILPMVRRVGASWGLLDQPDVRKVHTAPIPRVGGIGLALGTLLVSAGGLGVLHWQGTLVPPELFRQLISILGAGAFIFLVGLVDDTRSVSPRFKALALVAASLAVCGSGTTLDVLYFSGQPWLELGLAAWPATILFIVGVSVAVNFIDGLDGLAGGLVLLAAAALAGFAMLSGASAAAVVPLALAGSLAGFLLYNSNPASVFMGDCGSFFIGFVVASAMVLANPVLGTMEAMLIPALALSVPLVDTAVTLFRRRYLQRRSMFAAERGHVHHRLLDQGLSQRQAVFALYGVSVLCVGIGVLAWFSKSWQTVGSLSLLVPVLWGAFRLAGSVRTREMVTAVRHKRYVDRINSRFETAFYELQMQFERAADFSGWWQAVCDAAQRLEFGRVEIELLGRDNKPRSLVWEPAEPLEAGIARLTATVPVAERRRAEPIHAHVEVVATRSVESAGARLALFTRLMSDHSVAALPGAVGRSSTSTNPGPGDRAVPDPVVHKGRHEHPAGALKEGPLAGKRIALVHDFLYVYAGAEKVLEQMIELYPDADLFALFDFLPDDQRGFLRGKPVKTSFLQKMPFARSHHRHYLPLMPLAIEQLDLSGYDIVLTSSYMAAKGVITGPDQVHVCYCHSPARYAWDLQHQYLDQNRIGFGPKGLLTRMILHYIRNWDARSALGVDVFVTNSRFVAQRVRKLYRRESTVVYPPVDTGFFCPHPDPSPSTTGADFYVTASRLVPYKRIDLVIDAFNRMPDKRLIVVGDGPDRARLQKLAGPNVTLAGFQPDEELRRYLRLAKAFVFAAEEDFGIVPVEAMACGTPVIAYAAGGACESVQDGATGSFFREQSPTALVAAVERFEAGSDAEACTDPAKVANAMERFSQERFRAEIGAAVEVAWRDSRGMYANDTATASPSGPEASTPPGPGATTRPPTQPPAHQAAHQRASNEGASSVTA